MFTDMRVGLANKIKILDRYLSCERVKLAYAEGPGVINRHQVNHMLGRISKKVAKEYKSFLEQLKKKSGVLFVIQDEYEVKALKGRLDDYMVVKPLAGLLRMAREEKLKRQELNAVGIEETRVFARTWFPGLEDEIAQIFSLYRDRVLCYSGSFYKLLREEFDGYRPAALLYSIGAHTLYEDMAASIANDRNIPVFYFQHGGATVYFRDPYNKYVEENININKNIHTTIARRKRPSNEGFLWSDHESGVNHPLPGTCEKPSAGCG